ncbi:MAG TPA: preprotein translocase subunit SecE [Ktedonobacterales bacterium]|nr:preprotein translocase subunit SecE [Ktedonobacterales bacterium]
MRTPSTDDEALRDQELDPAGESLMDEEVEQLAEEQEAVDAGDPLPAAFASDQALTATTNRTALRTYTVPSWTLGNPVTRFIAESYIELRKVTWPTWNEAWNWTLIVIAMSAVVALILAAADLGLARLLTWVVSLSG